MIGHLRVGFLGVFEVFVIGLHRNGKVLEFTPSYIHAGRFMVSFIGFVPACAYIIGTIAVEGP